MDIKQLKTTTSSRIGEEWTSNQGLVFKIVGYINSENVIVERVGGKCRYVALVKYGNLTRGLVKDPYHPNLYGVGYIGFGKYTRKGNELAYSYFSNMIKRCYHFDFLQERENYIDCTVCEEWHNFQNFAEWFYENYYEIDGEVMCLDKDILIKDNRVYSPETCVFVPKTINNIFTQPPKRKKYDLPQGIKIQSGGNKYTARITIFGKEKHLGSFDTVDDALFEYNKNKKQHIKNVAELYKNNIPQNVYLSMINWDI